MIPVRRKKKDFGRLEIRIPTDIEVFIKEYAERENTTITKIIIDHFKALREKATHVPQC